MKNLLGLRWPYTPCGVRTIKNQIGGIEVLSGINTLGGILMYFYVYQITNLINNKIYVGKHKSEKHPTINGYYGSGKQIIAAVKKYGVENFKKEVLYYCSSKEDMAAKEEEIVTEDFVKRSDTYNMHKGGNGGWEHWNGSKLHTESSKRGGRASVKKLNEFIAEQKANNTAWWQDWYTKVCETNRELTMRAQSPAAQEKRKNTFKEIKHSRGEKNSQFGRIWISNVLTKEVKRITINDAIPEGWVRGKKGHVIKECWVNNGTKEHFIILEKKQEYLDKGFIAGRLKTSVPQKQNSLKIEAR